MTDDQRIELLEKQLTELKALLAKVGNFLRAPDIFHGKYGGPPPSESEQQRLREYKELVSKLRKL